MANAHGSAQVASSLTVTSHSSVSGPVRRNRSMRRSVSPEPRYGALPLKFVVSTTSVSPSQYARESPSH